LIFKAEKKNQICCHFHEIMKNENICNDGWKEFFQQKIVKTVFGLRKKVFQGLHFDEKNCILFSQFQTLHHFLLNLKYLIDDFQESPIQRFLDSDSPNSFSFFCSVKYFFLFISKKKNGMWREKTLNFC